MNVSRAALGALATSLHLHPSIIVSTAFSISKGSYRILLGLRQPARGVGTAHVWQDSISSDRKTFTLTAHNKESLSDDVNSSSSQKEASTTTKKKKTKTDAEKGWTTERSILPKLWQPKEEDDTQCFTIVSWNVNGLRSVIRKDPQALSDLLSRTQCHPDVICLQETKLQVMHVGDDKLGLKGLLEEEGYRSYWSCSTARKGYSGTAVFVRKDRWVGSNDDGEENIDVDYGIGKLEHDEEGRSIIIHFPHFSIANLYCPNSGAALKRLDYRMEWDDDLLTRMQEIVENRRRPVIWLGDLNVAHKRLDVYNYGAKHLLKQAGCTIEEKDSFSRQLGAGFVDIFRYLHPDAEGQYTYWSTRTRARKPNRGLRLDYFVGSSCLLDTNGKIQAKDSYILFDQEGSDHCPVVLELEIKN